MRKYILATSFVILALMVVGVLGWMVQSGQNANQPAIGYDKSEKQPALTQKAGETWVSKMAQVSTREYHFPVNELFIKLQPQQAKPIKKQVYQLVIEQSDKYSQFCIVQTLNSFSFPFTLIRDKAENRIYVQAQNPQNLNAVVEKLKEYSIESSVKEAWL